METRISLQRDSDDGEISYDKDYGDERTTDDGANSNDDGTDDDSHSAGDDDYHDYVD